MTDTSPAILNKDLEKVLGVLPHFRHAIEAYKWIQNKRLHAFLRGLDGTEAGLSEADRARFEHYVNSREGTELLAEYVDAVVRSRSETVNAAFAILYSDPGHVVFALDLKEAAAMALQGLAERSIDAFLLVMSQREALLGEDREDSTHLYSISDAGPLPPGFVEWSSRGAVWVATIQDLIARGLLFPDSLGGGRLTHPGQTWACHFGIGEDSEAYAILLNRARGFLRGSR